MVPHGEFGGIDTGHTGTLTQTSMEIVKEGNTGVGKALHKTRIAYQGRKLSRQVSATYSVYKGVEVAVMLSMK